MGTERRNKFEPIAMKKCVKDYWASLMVGIEERAHHYTCRKGNENIAELDK